MTDGQAVLVSVNEAAALVLPGARPGVALADVAPDWLTVAAPRAHREAGPGGDPVARGAVAGRTYAAHPASRGDGCVVWWLVDDTDQREARDALTAERERTAFLTRASNLLLSSLNLDRCMGITARLAADELADAAVVIAAGHGRELPVVTARRGMEPAHSSVSANASRVPGLAEALQGFPPVPSRWIDPAAAPSWLVPEGFGAVGAIAIVPLPGHGVPAGALVLLRRERSAAFTEAEEVFARLFAARAGVAMSAARLYAEQASISETLMRALLPPTLRQVAGVEYAGGYRPSKDHERVGGDFYDVHPAVVEGGPCLVVLGDVCGKGLEAAVLTGRIRNTLQALLPMAEDHEQMLGLLNTSLLNTHDARYATMVLASAQRRGSTVQLRLTSAGHPRPLVLRADGRVEEAATRGTLIGALAEVSAVPVEVVLGPGEACVLYTDGIVEARGGPLGGTEFGEERLRRTLSHCAGMPAEAVVEHVQMTVAAWVGSGRHDDMAVVVIAAPRSNHLSAVDGRTKGRFTT
ncbi:GAF domain-containing SpoIIE family protein phosphatase [Streptomyces sp. NPDC089919]|uniref:PP2C family protein-serine/threonine phosphatase n=1 Tax=Streptomyces sp. NPDC089919 TaxID=3155188 RepID=UPI0034180A92